MLESLWEGLADEIEGKTIQDFTLFQDDPVGFYTEVLRIPRNRIWSKLEEITLSVRENPYTTVMSANSVGKTWVAARIVAWWLNCFPDSKVVTTAAPPERQIRKLVWGEIRATYFKAKANGIELVGLDPGVMSWQVGPDWWAEGFTIPQTGTTEDRMARFHGHHSPHLLFILDEAQGIPPEVFDAVDDCLSGGHNHLLLLSNPLARRGKFYESTKDPKFNIIQISAFDHPNVRTGRNMIPGCITRQTTVERIQEWSRSLEPGEVPDSKCFVVPSFVGMPFSGTTRRVTNFKLDYKALGRFPTEAEDTLIPLTLIQAAQERWNPLPPAVEAIGGLDVAEMGVDHNAWIVRRGSWVGKPKRWNGLDPIETGDKVVALANQEHSSLIYVDANNIGAGVAPYLIRKGVEAMGIKASQKPTQTGKRVNVTADGQGMVEKIEFPRLRDQLLWAIREWLRMDMNAMLPPDEQLIEELSILNYGVNNQGKIEVMKKTEIKELIGRSPDALDALALTFYSGKRYKEMEEFVHV